MFELIAELERHIEDCEISKMRHFDYSDICSRRIWVISRLNNFFVGIILTWVLSTQFKSIVGYSFYLHDVIPVMMALLLAGLHYFEKGAGFDRERDNHLSAGKKYHTIFRECKNWKSDFSEKNEDEFYIFVKGIREKLNSINMDSPHITIYQQKRIEKFRKNNGWISKNSYASENR